jgi:hypothetical protein
MVGRYNRVGNASLLRRREPRDDILRRALGQLDADGLPIDVFEFLWAGLGRVATGPKSGNRPGDVQLVPIKK